MPYIKQHKRDEFKEILNTLGNIINTEGDLNYVITSLLVICTKKWIKSYSTLNTIMGVMSCSAQEFYRRVVAPYEDQKIKENGDIDL